ncbi:MAG: ECF transporter S component [Candidatus Izemoplasma sp.]|nr:ECF transporter S component [Candidatus Izemoplasma sp.]
MNNTRVLVEVAILVAMAFVLEFAFSFLPNMPQGGRVSISVLPLIVIAWRNGPLAGVIGGVVYGLLNLMLDGVLYHWGSFFLDYTIAFGVIGLVGFIKRFTGDNIVTFALAIVVGYCLRFLSHVLAGVLLFSEYAGDQNVWVYSIVYNATYLLPALILTLLVGVVVYFPLKQME